MPRIDAFLKLGRAQPIIVAVPSGAASRLQTQAARPEPLIAAFTLAGTGITTYICPVSVSIVVMSRTTAPFFFSVILPA